MEYEQLNNPRLFEYPPSSSFSIDTLLEPLGALIVSPFRDQSSPVQSHPIQHIGLIIKNGLGRSVGSNRKSWKISGSSWMEVDESG